MGKRYWSELELLDETYEWARTVEAGDIRRLREVYAGQPLLAVGSGGSYSSAVLAAYLHRHATGRLASAITPLEIVHSQLDFRLSSVLFLTAGGGNPDVMGAFRKIAAKEPARLGILCMKKNSPLSRAAREFSNIDQFEFRLPAGKDGFLATNSLLATSVLVARGYQSPHDVSSELPATLVDVAYGGRTSEEYLSWLDEVSSPLWQRETLVVLYGPGMHAAAVDLESKFTEAALGQVQLADYRNFAHGRHHWLAKHGETTAVLGFVTDDVRDVAEKTLKLIPSSVPLVQIDLGAPGPAAAIGGIVNTLQLVGLIGKSMGVDPGRPHVPTFGRKIYHLKAFPTARRRKTDPSPIAVVAVDRKLQSSPDARLNGHVAEWRDAYRRFTSELGTQRFGALVCDYDGTLCDQSRRFSGPRTEVLDHLRSLLKFGIIVGVASGRGTSLRDVLRKHIDRKYWKHVILGYYNGAEISSLADGDHPDNRPRAGRQLSSMAQALAQDEHLTEIADVDVREKQISIVPRSPAQGDVCWDRVQAALSRQSTRGIKTFRSGHSVDVVAPTVSKRNLVDVVRGQLADSDLSILCIGDRGRWPGNDSELLLEPHSLSVDEVSSAADSCWNLASPGIRYVDAVLEYFGRIRIGKAYFCFDSTEAD